MLAKEGEKKIKPTRNLSSLDFLRQDHRLSEQPEGTVVGVISLAGAQHKAVMQEQAGPEPQLWAQNLYTYEFAIGCWSITRLCQKCALGFKAFSVPSHPWLAWGDFCLLTAAPVHFSTFPYLPGEGSKGLFCHGGPPFT